LARARSVVDAGRVVPPMPTIKGEEPVSDVTQ
jgi:hypothetical protein